MCDGEMANERQDNIYIHWDVNLKLRRVMCVDSAWSFI